MTMPGYVIADSGVTTTANGATITWERVGKVVSLRISPPPHAAVSEYGMRTVTLPDGAPATPWPLTGDWLLSLPTLVVDAEFEIDE